MRLSEWLEEPTCPECYVRMKRTTWKDRTGDKSIRLTCSENPKHWMEFSAAFQFDTILVPELPLAEPEGLLD